MARGGELPNRAFIQEALREGRSATAALSAYRASGGRVRTQSFYRAWGEAERALGRSGAEAAANLGARPGAGNIEEVRTTHARGYGHVVQVVGVNPKTGEAATTTVTIRSDTLLERREAVAMAVGRVEEDQERYELRPVGGIYTGTERYVL